jgi:hypothetical protein
MTPTNVLRKHPNTYSFSGLRHSFIDFISSPSSCGLTVLRDCWLRCLLLLPQVEPCELFLPPYCRRISRFSAARVSHTSCEQISIIRLIVWGSIIGSTFQLWCAVSFLKTGCDSEHSCLLSKTHSTVLIHHYHISDILIHSLSLQFLSGYQTTELLVKAQ